METSKELTVHHEKNPMGYWEYNAETGKSTSGATALNDIKAYALQNGYTSILVIRGRQERSIELQ